MADIPSQAKAQGIATRLHGLNAKPISLKRSHNSLQGLRLLHLEE